MKIEKLYRCTVLRERFNSVVRHVALAPFDCIINRYEHKLESFVKMVRMTFGCKIDKTNRREALYRQIMCKLFKEQLLYANLETLDC